MPTPSLRLVLAATLIGSTVGCNPDEIVSSSAELAAPGPRASLAPAQVQEPPQEPLQLAYSKTFVRAAGHPHTYSEALDLSRFEGDFVLTVTSGDGSGGDRVRAGSLKVDGVELLGPASFAGATVKVAGVELIDNAALAGAARSFVFTFAAAPTAIEVTLLGPPRGSLRVEIQGHPRRWRVCPGETYYRTYSTVQEAVAAADPGAKIWICDGTHFAAAVVDKPLTILPEHAGAVTLRDTLAWTPTQPIPNAGGPAPVFWIDGVAGGTFKVAGIKFVLRQSALVATGAWFRVVLEDIHITSVDSAHTFAVRVFPGDENSQLELNRGSITGVATGIFAVGGTVNVSGVAFERTGQGITFTNIFARPLTAARGRIENNVFGSCGLDGCLRIHGRGGVTAVANTFTKPVSSPAYTAIQVRTNASQVGIPQLAIRVENNTITGLPSSTPTIIPSWLLPTGVQVLTTHPDASPSHITIVGNRFDNAAEAVQVNSTNGSSIHVHDNAFSGGHEALRRNIVQRNGINVANSHIIFRRNDVDGVVHSFIAHASQGTLDATCNWWGSTSGPVQPQWQGDASVYTPWATEPIAGRSHVSCP